MTYYSRPSIRRARVKDACEITAAFAVAISLITLAAVVWLTDEGQTALHASAAYVITAILGVCVVIIYTAILIGIFHTGRRRS